MASSSENPPLWECRWPDPVALRVSAERILRELPKEDPSLNRNLPIMVVMESTPTGSETVQAILVTPWAVERIFWHHDPNTPPPIQFAVSLDKDVSGRVAAGQGVLLQTKDNQLIPVVIAWEPETGHYFVETLLHHTQDYDTPQEAMNVALGLPSPHNQTNSISSTLHRKVSRRNLLGFWRA